MSPPNSYTETLILNMMLPGGGVVGGSRFKLGHNGRTPMMGLRLEKTLESPLDRKEIQPVNPKGNQSWIFTRRTDAEAETLILWPPDAKNWLIWKDSDIGKDWRWEKGTTKDEMVGWHHRLNGHEFEETPGVGDRQEGLVCCSPWGCKESDMTEQQHWTEEEEKRPELSLSQSHENGARRQPSTGQEEGSHPIYSSNMAPWSLLLASKILRNKCLFFKLLSLCYFSTSTQAKTLI